MKNKILTFSFDDCEIYDRALCDLFRKYGMKATFFLLTGSFSQKVPFHRYGEDTVVERISSEEIPVTYKDMEVASHTHAHRFDINDYEGTVQKSIDLLSSLCGYKANGFAYPGGHYNEEMIELLRKNGVAYARTAAVTHSFDMPSNLFAWNPTAKYDDEAINDLADKFLSYSGDEPILFYIYGHSYELTQKEKGKSFESFEALLKKLAFRDDILYATNMEVVKKYYAD